MYEFYLVKQTGTNIQFYTDFLLAFYWNAYIWQK